MAGDEDTPVLPREDVTFLEVEGVPETEKCDDGLTVQEPNLSLPVDDMNKTAREISIYSPRMIGHGNKRDTAWYTEEIRAECAAAGADTACHSHIKKDFYMFNRFPKTSELLLKSSGALVNLFLYGTLRFVYL